MRRPCRVLRTGAVAAVAIPVAAVWLAPWGGVGFMAWTGFVRELAGDAWRAVWL